jgi:hypothetical protein
MLHGRFFWLLFVFGVIAFSIFGFYEGSDYRAEIIITDMCRMDCLEADYLSVAEGLLSAGKVDDVMIMNDMMIGFGMEGKAVFDWAGGVPFYSSDCKRLSQ